MQNTSATNAATASWSPALLHARASAGLPLPRSTRPTPEKCTGQPTRHALAHSRALPPASSPLTQPRAPPETCPNRKAPFARPHAAPPSNRSPRDTASSCRPGCCPSASCSWPSKPRRRPSRSSLPQTHSPPCRAALIPFETPEPRHPPPTRPTPRKHAESISVRIASPAFLLSTRTFARRNLRFGFPQEASHTSFWKTTGKYPPSARCTLSFQRGELHFRGSQRPGCALRTPPQAFISSRLDPRASPRDHRTPPPAKRPIGDLRP